MHPLERRQLVKQAIISGRIPAGLFRQLRVNQETENAEAIIHRHDHYALLRQMCAVLPRLGGCPRHESSAIDPNHHRQFFAGLRLGGNPHVQRQAVFTAACIAKFHIAKYFSLHAVRAKFRRLAHSGPLRHGCRRFPSQIANRWCSVWNSKKRANRTIILALDNATVSFHLRP